MASMKKYKTTEELLEKTPVHRLILRLGIPAMFGQFFNLLYSIVDRIFVGQIADASDVALASIGVCAPAFTAVTAFAYMIGIGGASYMSISLGQKNQQQTKDILGNAFWLLVGISGVVTTVLLLLHRPVLYLLGCSDAMYPFARDYFIVYICGTIASLCGIGLNQFLLAQGFAKQGMFAVVIGAVVNVLFDPLLIFGWHMGIAGAATATVIAQICMAVYVLLQLCNRRMPVRLGFCKLQRKISVRIITIGSMSFLITLMDNLIIILLNVVLRTYGGASQGDQLITCAAVVQSFMTIVSCPAQGITTGCGTVFSYHYGRGNYKKISQAFIGVFLLCGTYIGLLEILVQAFPQAFTGLFLQNSALSQQASESIRMYTLALIGVAVQYALVDGLTALGIDSVCFPTFCFPQNCVCNLCFLFSDGI